jgi:type VII secretion-associated serine protease mycosin
VWPITKGANVLVAVIDTGLDTDNAQLRHLHLHQGVDTYGLRGTQDCDGHGTEITGIIAAQPGRSAFVGVAPDATIMPIKQTNTFNQNGNSATLAAGIDAAAEAGVRVANVSVYVSKDTPALRAAVRHAKRAGMVIVAAAGNDGKRARTWPAAYSTRFSNVIAVGATTQDDTVASFSNRGSYIDVVAPGDQYQEPRPHGGFTSQSGTSFAAPYVTGTVALMLSADPGLSPAQVRRRLEQTADAPPAATPSQSYGYGMVNSYLAVTAVIDSSASPPPTRTPSALAAPPAPHSPDRHLQHLALAAAFALLGLAALVVAATGVLRSAARGRHAGRRIGAGQQPPG